MTRGHAWTDTYARLHTCMGRQGNPRAKVLRTEEGLEGADGLDGVTGAQTSYWGGTHGPGSL